MAYKALLSGLICAANLFAFAKTINVPEDGDIQFAITNVVSGDHIVIAASTEPYIITKAITVPSGVTLRGASGDRNDVVISGNKAVAGMTLSSGSVVSNLTLTSCVSKGGTAGVIIPKDAKMENCRITSCYSTARGSWGVAVKIDGTLKKSCIDGNYLASDLDGHRGIAVYANAATVLMEDVIITNNWCSLMSANDGYWYGGAGIRANGGTYRRCYFGGNSLGVIKVGVGTVGSGFYATAAVTLENCTIEGNLYDGAEVDTIPGCYLSNASSKMKNTILFNNRHVDGYVNNAVLNGSDSNYSNNASDGIKSTYAAKVKIEVSSDDFVRIGGLLYPKAGGRASGLGALPDWDGITPEDAPPPPTTTNTVSDITLLQAAIDAAKIGDVILIPKGTYAVTSSITVRKGVTVAGETGDFNDVILDANHKCRVAALNAGGILKNVTLYRGRINGSGSGVTMGLGSRLLNCRVTGSVFLSTYNNSPNGVAVYNNGGKVVNSLIDNNRCEKARYRAIGYFQEMGCIDGCIISNNVAVSTMLNDGNHLGNAGFQLKAGIMRNCIVTGNSQGNVTHIGISPGTGGHAAGKGARIINSLIYNNTYYGLYSGNIRGVNTDDNASIINCVILNNGYMDSPTQNFVGATRHRNNVSTADAVANCTDSFEGSMDFFIMKDGRYDIRLKSPLIDAGYNLNYVVFGNDVYSRKRLQGEKIDIGPFEYQLKDFDCMFTSPEYLGYDRLETKATAIVDGIDTEVSVYRWYLNDSEEPFAEGADKATVTITLPTVGEYKVRMVVINTSGRVAEFTQKYLVKQRTYYVRAGNENAAAPYATWETASSSIADAVAAATSGDTVLLDEGVYLDSSRININKALTIRGVSREGTIISGGGARKVILLLVKDARLENLTVENGFSSAGQGDGVGVGVMAGAVVSNCVIRNCKSSSNSYGVGLYCNDGLVVDTVISNCTGGCGTGFYLTGNVALLNRVLVVGNDSGNKIGGDGYIPAAGGGVIKEGSSEVRASVIVSNKIRIISWKTNGSSPSASGVLLYSGKMVNCTVVGNTHADNDASGNYSGALGGVGLGGGTVKNCLIADNYSSGTQMREDITLKFSAINNCITCCTYPAEALPAGNVSSVGKPVYRYVPRLNAYKLVGGSPCIDAGTWESWMEGERDIYGKMRTSRHVDIGASVFDMRGFRVIVR